MSIVSTINGYLSRDAEQRSTRTGESVTNWNVPTKIGFGENESTVWFRVSIWGKRADYAAKFRKGDFVTVTGEHTMREYEGKTQHELRAYDFQAVNMGPKEARQTGGGDWSGGVKDHFPQAEDLDDSIPF